MMRIAGLASGMDINQIVNDLMRAERIPMDKLFQKREWLSWQQEAYREMNLALRTFRDTYAHMRLQSTFIGTKATSSNPLGLGATAGSAAQAGNYQVVVEQLAKGAELHSRQPLRDINNQAISQNSNIFEAMGRSAEEGDFTIYLSVSDGERERTAEITITSQDTFASLAQKLSRAAVTEEGRSVSLGVQATFDNTLGRFFIGTRQSGAQMQLSLWDGQDAEGNEVAFIARFLVGDEEAGSLYQAQGDNARFTIDGMAVESAENTVQVRGLTLTLNEIGEYTISVQADPDQVFEQIKAFVEAYNELIDTITKKLNEPRYRDYPPLTDEQREALSESEAKRWDERARSGLLRNDALLRQVLNELRQAWTNPIEGIPEGQLRHLAQIGITTTSDWTDGGKLQIDETKLKEAIAQRPDEVMALFTQAPQQEDNKAQMGIGRRLYQLVTESINRLRDRAGSPGITGGDQSVLGKQLRDVEDQLARWEERLKMIEDRYWRQFTAMEKAVQQMNEQSMFLLSHFYNFGA